MRHTAMGGWVGLAVLGVEAWAAPAPTSPAPTPAAKLIVEPLAFISAPARLPDELSQAVVLTEGPLLVRAGVDEDALALVCELSLSAAPVSKGAFHDDPVLKQGDHLFFHFAPEGPRGVRYEFACSAQSLVWDAERAKGQDVAAAAWQSGATLHLTRTTLTVRWCLAIPLTALHLEHQPKGAVVAAGWAPQGKSPPGAWHPLEWPAFKASDGPPWLGAGIGDIDPTELEKLELSHGVYVHQVVPGSPAAEAGLLVDDILLSVNGQDVDTLDQVIGVIQSLAAGKVIPVECFRNGQKKMLRVTLTPRPQEPPQP